MAAQRTLRDDILICIISLINLGQNNLACGLWIVTFPKKLTRRRDFISIKDELFLLPVSPPTRQGKTLFETICFPHCKHSNRRSVSCITYMDEPKWLIQMFSSFEIFSTTCSVSITPLFLYQSTAIAQEAANKALPGAVLRILQFWKEKELQLKRCLYSIDIFGTNNEKAYLENLEAETSYFVFQSSNRYNRRTSRSTV